MDSENVGVYFVQEQIPTSILIVDESIIWYGAMPMLATVSELSLLRLESEKISKEIQDKFEIFD